jgi:hypothetical protein
VDRVAELTAIDPDAFARVVRHVRGAERIGEQQVAAVLAGYLAGAQQLVAHIDRLSTSPDGP